MNTKIKNILFSICLLFGICFGTDVYIPDTLPPPQEQCGNFALFSVSDMCSKFLPKIMNLRTIILDNIKMDCDSIFLSKQLYNSLSEHNKMLFNRDLNNINAKLFFSDSIFFCEKYDYEKRNMINLSGKCGLIITSAGLRISDKFGKELGDSCILIFNSNDMYCIENYSVSDDSYILHYNDDFFCSIIQ